MFSSISHRVQPILALVITVILTMFGGGLSSPVSAHGGGLDGNGGHNCNVGACAGTYHCHRAPCGGIRPAPTLPPTWTPTPVTTVAPRITSPPTTGAPQPTTTVLRKASCVSMTLESYSKAETVLLQETLARDGFYPHSIDGIFGDGTTNAVRRAATEFSLTITDASEKNEDLLRGLDLACSTQTMPTLRISTSGAPADAASCVSPSGIPAQDEILLLQWALSERSFDVGPTDGVFGNRTLAAISGFETANQRLLVLASSETRIQSKTLELLGISCSLPREIELLPTSASTAAPATPTLVSVTSPVTQNPKLDAVQDFSNEGQPNALANSDDAALFIGGASVGFFAGLVAMFLLRRLREAR